MLIPNQTLKCQNPFKLNKRDLSEIKIKTDYFSKIFEFP